MFAEVCGETYSKNNCQKWSRKTVTDLITPQNKGKTQRDRERTFAVPRCEYHKSIGQTEPNSSRCVQFDYAVGQCVLIQVISKHV